MVTGTQTRTPKHPQNSHKKNIYEKKTEFLGFFRSVNLHLVSEELEVYLGTSYNELYVQCPDGSYTSCYIYRLRLRIPAEGFREGPFCT